MDQQLSKTKEKEGGTVALSKALSWLLRHNAPKEGFKVHAGGFVSVEDVLKHRRFKNWTAEDIQKVVQQNDKQRFALRSDLQTGKLQIRATQGHSFKVEDEELLEPITDPEKCVSVIHGTYFRFWESIKKSGLSRMKRNHIHFAAGEPGTDEVKSGIRKSAEVYIYIDLQKALHDGIKFYRSENNVILSSGNENGFIEPKYFLKVINAKSGKSQTLI